MQTHSKEVAPELDLDFARAHFPALNTPWALFDNAGGSAPCRQVIERAASHLSELPFQLGAGYDLSQRAGEAVQRGRAAAAELVNVAPDEVVLGGSSTGLVGTLARALGATWAAGDEVVVTDLDHETNIGPWRALEARGLVLREWRYDERDHRLHLEGLEPLLSERTRLVAFTHCANVVGTIHDVPAVCARIREAGALSCVDGVAFAPHRRVDVPALGADLYFLSLYKTFGPHMALLAARREVLARARNQNHFFVGEDAGPSKLEPGNVNYELAASLPGILEYFEALDHRHFPLEAEDPGRLDRISDLFAAQEGRAVRPLIGFLGEHPKVRIVGEPTADMGARVPTVAFTVEGMDSRAVVEGLERHRVAGRYGHFYARRAIERMGLLPTNGIVRLSLVHYNGAGEVLRALEALEDVLG